MIPLPEWTRLGYLTTIGRHFAYLILDHRVYADDDKLSLSPEAMVLSQDIPYLEYSLYPLIRREFSPLNHPVSMDKWATSVKEYIDQHSSTRWQKLYKWITLPETLKSIQVWEDNKVEYWLQIILIVSGLWYLDFLHRESITWELENQSLNLVIRGQHTIEGVNFISFPNSDQTYWLLDIKPELFKGASPQIFRNKMLIAQFLAYQGQGKLLVTTDKKELMMRLEIPRADINLRPAQDWSLSSDAVAAFALEIANQTGGAMETSCLQLEQTLLADAKRLALETDGKVNLDIKREALAKIDEDSYDEAARINNIIQKALEDIEFGKQMIAAWKAGLNPINPSA